MRAPWYVRVEDLAGKPRGGAMVYVFVRQADGTQGAPAELFRSFTGSALVNPVKAGRQGEVVAWLETGGYLWRASYSGFTTDLVPFDVVAAGTGEDKTFVHIQSTPAATWEIPHMLGKFPAITVVDSAGSELTGDVHHIDINNARVLHNGATAGKAYCN